MINLYEYNLKTNFKKLICDELLCVEFQCIPGDIRGGVWSQHSYLAFIQSGKKTWITPDGEFPVTIGDAIYCKKGGSLVQNYYEEQFCAVIFFFPDEFIREVITESGLINQLNDEVDSNVIRLDVNLRLKLYFESMITYFLAQKNPSKQLLLLKFKELILQVLTSPGNDDLAAYFLSLAKEEKTNLRQIMNDNYLYHLSQKDFARLTHRSVSSFKRDFRETFGTSLNKWLTVMRLKYAKMRLFTTDENINDIAFNSGFETTSHFIRCFKKHYGLPPQQFRQQNLLVTQAV